MVQYLQFGILKVPLLNYPSDVRVVPRTQPRSGYSAAGYSYDSFEAQQRLPSLQTEHRNPDA